MNERAEVHTPIASVPAHEHLAHMLRQSDGKVTVVFTGPLTDLAAALTIDPDLAECIEELVWMGGCLDGDGNVHEPGFDGTAEWNAFWDPDAVSRVWQSDIPIVMFPLEATRNVPVTRSILRSWAQLRSCSREMEFVGQCYAICAPFCEFGPDTVYYFWDVLTVAYVGRPSLVELTPVQCIVHTDGPSEGRIAESTYGKMVQVAKAVRADKFYQYITGVLTSHINV
ncbi:hypothetical protein GCM10010885_23160 [Alicyclobacillus cellulosilyticus]|uniref:Inosine/uridine-preferring nucleoside hydrolase domain-containing protein n=1 Tax=Alicyclobacillus cellulosilyticus TaxID=1003997 RepID=A0A917NNC9_9BACL|nr:hypothetical protein GCM10010885_23160 [Alicyclobacillus cellulosilyticus]